MALATSSSAEIDICRHVLEEEADGQAADEDDAADPSAHSVIRLHASESPGDPHHC